MRLVLVPTLVIMTTAAPQTTPAASQETAPAVAEPNDSKVPTARDTQAVEPTTTTRLTTGARVRIKSPATGKRPSTAKIVGMDERTMTVRLTRSERTVTVTRAAIETLEVSTSQQRSNKRTIAGATVIGSVGMLGGWFFGGVAERGVSQTGQAPPHFSRRGAVLGGLVGAMLGGGIGAAFDRVSWSETWQPVPRDGIAIAVRPTLQGRGVAASVSLAF